MEDEKEGELNFEFTKSQEELVKKYNLTKEQITLFRRLRLENIESEILSDFHIIEIIFCKKTYVKASKWCKEFTKVLVKYNYGDVKFDQKLFDDLEYLRKILKARMCFWFEDSRTKDGYGIFYMDYGMWVPTKTDQERKKIVQLFLAMFEIFMKQDTRNVTDGITFFMDFEKFGWNCFDIHIEKLFGEVFKFFPCRFKYCSLFNCPWYISLVLKLLKPFMSKKMQKRLRVMKANEAMALVGRKHFPNTMGGNYKFNYRKLVKEYFDIDVGRIKRSKRKKKENEKEIRSKRPKNEFSCVRFFIPKDRIDSLFNEKLRLTVDQVVSEKKRTIVAFAGSEMKVDFDVLDFSKVTHVGSLQYKKLEVWGIRMGGDEDCYVLYPKKRVNEFLKCLKKVVENRKKVVEEKEEVIEEKEEVVVEEKEEVVEEKEEVIVEDKEEVIEENEKVIEKKEVIVEEKKEAIEEKEEVIEKEVIEEKEDMIKEKEEAIEENEEVVEENIKTDENFEVIKKNKEGIVEEKAKTDENKGKESIVVEEKELECPKN